MISCKILRVDIEQWGTMHFGENFSALPKV